MERSPIAKASTLDVMCPAPPSLHWAVLLAVAAGAEALVIWLVPRPYRDLSINLIAAAWPIYLSLWIRKIDPKSTALYWALASFATGFLFSWLLWIVVIFEVREDLLEHYNRREPVGLRLNWFLTALFSFVYFQYRLRPIALEKKHLAQQLVEEAEPFIIP
jgi:hypothetical protein